MSTTSRVSEIGSLIGDPARCAMLMALMDGRALTATELAAAAGVAPPTASAHLAQLTNAGLLEVLRQGRHRYHRIASPEVARLMEGVMAVAAQAPASRRISTGPRDQRLRRLRTCYDHLAGSVAVAIAEALVGAGHLELHAEGGRITASGARLLEALPVELGAGPRFVRPCLDWSERRFHLGGELGAALQRALVSKGWIVLGGDRTVTLTPAGRRGLQDRFGIDARQVA